MGTQQLLLIVLGVIVVGIAVVTGITIFGVNSQQANIDAVIEDCLRIATGAQSWFAKPRALGGGGASFTGLNLTKCGMPDPENENGTYNITHVHGTSAYITGVGKQSVIVTMRVYADSVSNPRILRFAELVVERE